MTRMALGAQFGARSLYPVQTPPARSLENWLRREARAQIEAHLQEVVRRTRRSPHRLYIMSQRTKWGNCSALGNLSFNWRSVMAPSGRVEVPRYA
jgi:predicted metal-dependent hydrolase